MENGRLDILSHQMFLSESYCVLLSHQELIKFLLNLTQRDISGMDQKQTRGKAKDINRINPSNLSLVPICFGRDFRSSNARSGQHQTQKSLSLLTAQIKHDLVASCSDTALPPLAMRSLCVFRYVCICGLLSPKIH